MAQETQIRPGALPKPRGENVELVLYSSNLFAHIFGICAL